MLTDDEVRKIRDGAVMGGRVPDYTAIWEIADELLKRRHPWRPIAELGEEHKNGRELLGKFQDGNYCELSSDSVEFYDFTHFMEIPELEEGDA